jgi:glycerophosphoryl diester phosphodiesterase
MQTLGDLLDQVHGQVPLVVEIKSLWNDDPRLTLRAIDIAENYEGNLAFMSFDPNVVACLAHCTPHTIRGIVADRACDEYYSAMSVAQRGNLRNFRHIGESRPHFISFDHAGLPYAPVQSLRASGMPVITWTIRSQEQASRALRYCDQITFEGYHPQ